MTAQSVKTFHFSWTAVGGATEYRLLESPDGSSNYTQVATISGSATTYDLSAFLPARINANYILQACNAAGCTNSAAFSITGNLGNAIGYLKASKSNSQVYFGSRIVLSADGNTLAVGTSNESSGASGINGNQNDTSAAASGAVYVFVRNGNTWLQQAYVKASNAEAQDRFGFSIALSADGDALAVGAPYEDSNSTGNNGSQSDNSAVDSGAVYLFTRNGNTWSQQAYIKASNASAYNHFGTSVALSSDGSTLAAGSPHSAPYELIWPGKSDTYSATYVFTRSSTTWSQQAIVTSSDVDLEDEFGQTVSLSADGNTLAVGAPGESSSATGINGDENDNSGSWCGAVYVFIRNGNSWSQQAYIKASNTESWDRFGSSIALSADSNTLAVGATGESSSTTEINGTQNDNSASGSGAVYLFSRSSTTWSQQTYVKASNAEAGDGFGYSMSLSADGNTLAVGVPDEGSSATGINGNQGSNAAAQSGAVYLFRRSDNAWRQQAYVKAPNSEAYDWFGNSIALSADGSTLSVGAYGESSSATGIGGNQSDNSVPNSGAVYLY
jgi:hypothetical protein